jgi:hypothetical protein
MNQYHQPTPEGKDPERWNQARRRAGFKTSLATYLVVNLFLVGIWAVTNYSNGFRGHFWPIWALLGWGIGLFFQYLGAYHQSSTFSVDKEYERLSNKQS